jgi:hypothetical protein
MDIETVTVIKYQAKINKLITKGMIQPIQHNDIYLFKYSSTV